mgnify:FL=1|jgi:hypothetical protein
MKNKLFITLCLSLGLTGFVSAGADDNEIWLQQSGDNLVLNFTQRGYGNKVGLDDFSGTSADMIITGASNTFTLLQDGDNNKLFGPFLADSSTVNLTFTGDSNSMDWNVGYVGSADNLNMLGVITGDSNTFDIDVGYEASAEYLNWDLALTGDSNVFTTKIDSDNAVWNWTITGSSNDINTNQSDATDNSITAVLTGSTNDIDIIQKSGTTGCPTGSSCSGIIDVSFVTSNANIDIVQKDSGE